MIYFQNITELEQAKLQYRTLAKQLHPDKGGSATEFNQMQQEYKTILIQLQQKQSRSMNHQPQKDNDILSELGKLAKVLIEKQVPQRYLQQIIKKSQSPLDKKLYSGLLTILNKMGK